MGAPDPGCVLALRKPLTSTMSNLPPADALLPRTLPPHSRTARLQRRGSAHAHGPERCVPGVLRDEPLPAHEGEVGWGQAGADGLGWCGVQPPKFTFVVQEHTRHMHARARMHSPEHKRKFSFALPIMPSLPPSVPPSPTPSPPQDAQAPGFKEISALVREPRPEMLLLPGLATRF